MMNGACGTRDLLDEMPKNGLIHPIHAKEG
uniref:Uncharacterized protein n=1 Tax=Setaria viridis TaxID=4556 RepID=A0A4U6UAI8_SETVI|nr:hypothetical protein SEVIR_6G202650v2 [Setaria viridis]